MNNKPWKSIFLKCLAAGLLAALLLPYTPLLPKILSLPEEQAIAQSTDLPASCYPRIPATRPANIQVTRITSTTYQGTEYRLYHVDAPGRKFLYVAALKGNRCQSAYSNPMGDEDFYFHKALPLPVARQMALGQVDFAIREAGGIDPFRKRFEQLPAGLAFAEEEVWALRQRRIQLPAGIKVVKAKR